MTSPHTNTANAGGEAVRKVEYVSFDKWLRAAIKSWHPDYDDDRVAYHVNSLYNASQCFPDEKGEMADVAKAQVMSCLTIWRSLDHAN